MSNLSGSGKLSGALRPSGGGPTDVYWDDILEKPNFSAVATSGSYNDLLDKPNIPTYTAGDGINIENGVISTSGSGVTKDLLYQAIADNDHPAQIVLSNSINNYDILVVNIDFTTNNRRYTLGYTYNCATLNDASNLGFDIGSGGNCWYSMGSDLKTLTFLQNSGSWHIANITGIKF